MTGMTTNPATKPGNMSPKTWAQLQKKHGTSKPHFQTASPKSGTPNSKANKGHKHAGSPKFGTVNINDKSHQIQQLPTHQTAQESAEQKAAKNAERQELAEKAGFTATTKTNTQTWATAEKKPSIQSNAMGNLGKIKNPSVCKSAQMPTGRQGKHQ